MNEELSQIISQAILDGQNQIHDLYQGKATAEQVNERMQEAFDYHYQRALNLIS